MIRSCETLETVHTHTGNLIIMKTKTGLELAFNQDILKQAN